MIVTTNIDSKQDRTARLTLPCQPHALPFRTIFSEYLPRRKGDLLRLIAEHMKSTPATTVSPERSQEDELFNRLHLHLTLSENLYASLAKAKEEQPGTTDTGLPANGGLSLAERVSSLEKECFDADLPLKKILHELEGQALCFSGGGIRSASYCLGVLQGLARYSKGIFQRSEQESPSRDTSLLPSLDYLSTVSGGGYIGSWWMAWVTRAGGTKDAFRKTIHALAGRAESTSGDPEPRTIRHLRDYTSFLTPKLGLSLDTWTLLAIVLRNLIINWAMLVPVIVAVVALPQVLRYLLLDFASLANANWRPLLLCGAGLAYFFAALAASLRMPSRQAGRPYKAESSEPWPVTGLFLIPVIIAAFLLAILWFTYVTPHSVAPSGGYRFSNTCFLYLFGIGFISFAALGVFLLPTYWRAARKDGDLGVSIDPRRTIWRGTEIAGAAALAGGLSAGALEASEVWSWNFLSTANETLAQNLFVLLAMPWICFVLLVTLSIFLGLIGLFEPEEDREWWARAGGLVIAAILVWITAQAIAIYGYNFNQGMHSLILASFGSAFAGLGLAGASSAVSSAGPRPVKASQLGALGKFLEKNHLLLPGLCAAALLVLTLEIASLEEWLRSLLHGMANLDSSLIILCIAAAAAVLVNWFINVNIFSLHGMYRMRLMRAFLGASNTSRKPDHFTGFDALDNLAETDLPHTEGVPLHIINTTLNLVGTQELAWQQRKAESFTFSPLCCGAWRIGYGPTEIYGGSRGLTLATAVAISGAAFNPNMGYHSSPLVTLLMTLFNVRLGWWLPNPRCAETRKILSGGSDLSSKGEKFLHKNGPTFALEPLLREALGLTNDQYEWIELTDGAHFENLALYEMVLRRCHRIIVVDVGADPQCQFEDLGNALRKIEIDLGIPIHFQANMHMEAGSKPQNRYCAAARIDYRAVDASADWMAPDGELIYIKAGLQGSEPPDIRQYAATHPTFPHQTTADQFFTEDQFESYRNLGSYVIEQIVENGLSRQHQGNIPTRPGSDMESFFRVAGSYCLPDT
jgi:hypothetical protein